jgi:hypothetical protein
MNRQEEVTGQTRIPKLNSLVGAGVSSSRVSPWRSGDSILSLGNSSAYNHASFLGKNII